MEATLIKTKLENQIIRTNGIDLHIVEGGEPDGTPVILLHGFPEFWYGWRHQIDCLANEGYRLIIPDQRGYNLSEKPSGIKSYRINHLVNDIIGILDNKKIDKIYLVGHDWGGMVAWYLALRHPDRFKCLVNINIPHPLVMKRTLLSSWEQLKKSWYIYFFQLPGMPEYVLCRQNYSNFKKVLVTRKGDFPEKEMAKYVEAWKQPDAVRSMINWYRASFQMMTQRIPDPVISIPTLLIWGMKDIALSHQMAQPSIDLCRNGRLEFIQNASHWVQHEEPELVNGFILDFLSKVSAG